MTTTKAAVKIKTKQIQKSEGIGKSEARDKVLSQNIISRKIGIKKVEFTYGQVDRFGIKLAKMGRNAVLAGLGIELIGSATAIYGILGEERKNIDKGMRVIVALKNQ